MVENFFYKLHGMYGDKVVYSNTILPSDLTYSPQKTKIGKVIHKGLSLVRKHKPGAAIVTIAIDAE